MSTSQLHLKIVSQERELVSTEVDLVIAPTTVGQITVLPGHLPLFSKLQTGELVYRQGGDEHLFAVSEGFIDVTPDREVTIIADMVTNARDVSLEKAQQAIKEAQETLASSQNQEELILAEASLRQALLEVKVAQKSRKKSL